MGNFGWADWSDFQMQGFFPALQPMQKNVAPHPPQISGEVWKM